MLLCMTIPGLMQLKICSSEKGNRNMNQKSMLNIPYTICSRRNMVGCLSPSESMLYAPCKVYGGLSSKRISLVECEGYLYYSICCSSLTLLFLESAASSV